MREVIRRLGRIKLMLVISLASILMSISLNLMFSVLMNQQLPTGEGIVKAGLIPLIITPAVSWYLLGLLLDLDKLEEKMNKLATYDDLTQLYNRRSFFKSAQHLHRIATHQQQPYCIMLLDLDHFKKINDQFGHATGDQVLESFGKIIKDIVGDYHLAGRIGGEEFCLMFKETQVKHLQNLIKRIDKAMINAQILKDSQSIKYTASIGVAEYRINERVKLEEILNQADIALYAAKNSGRNKVVFFNDELQKV